MQVLAGIIAEMLVILVSNPYRGVGRPVISTSLNMSLYSLDMSTYTRSYSAQCYTLYTRYTILHYSILSSS